MGYAPAIHQYIERDDGSSVDESLLADRVIRFLYSTAREHPSLLQRAAASHLTSALLASWEFDWPLRNPSRSIGRAAARMRINLDEVDGQTQSWRTMRDLFERKIRFWECRPMSDEPHSIVSPADGKALIFGHANDTLLPVKSRWLDLAGLLASPDLLQRVATATGLIVRLTPDAYHYVHAPVSGVVRSHRRIDGALHSCNPAALVSFASPYSINLRQVTEIDTDVYHGSRVGTVVLVNVGAMMIGRIEDASSADRYDDPQPVRTGLFVHRGQPFALFRPGSSTSIVLWRQDRAQLAAALTHNSVRTDVRSRFSDWLLSPWVETALQVRSTIAHAAHS